jgi:bifunctional UDP-N-acetylglucosamine pyrophosphorylase/glucosamine-1-phosphate N-acetyltransferase
MTVVSIILAAGQGTRMRSKKPKVLHQVAGVPMVFHTLEAVEGFTSRKPILVVGYEAEQVKAVVGSRADYVLQAQQLGTGHAVSVTRADLEGQADTVIVTLADMPLLTRGTLKNLLTLHQNSESPVTMTSFMGDEARGFGRVVRGEDGHVVGIVEQVDATPEQLKIREYNVSAYCFNANWLWGALDEIPVSPKGEYYLTDTIALAVDSGYKVNSLVLEDPTEGIGLNNRVHLATVNRVMRQRINQKWMLEGVTIVDPETTYIDKSVKIGMDTVILPNTYLQGETIIGEDCEIGPDTKIVDSKIGNSVQILMSVIEEAEVRNNVSMGPFCHLRKGAVLDEGVHLGNFGEVKDSYLGSGTKMGHFSYIGNAKIGTNVNIGAGTITCNYDGEKKNPTEIGDDVFIGSDTMLVAPVKIGDRSITAAGAVVTHDVPQDTLVMGVPAKEKQKKMEKSD